MVEANYGCSKDDLLKEFGNRGIEARPFFMPLHTLPPYRSYQAYQVSNALELYDKGINVPSNFTLEDDDLRFVVDTIKHMAQDL